MKRTLLAALIAALTIILVLSPFDAPASPRSTGSHTAQDEWAAREIRGGTCG